MIARKVLLAVTLTAMSVSAAFPCSGVRTSHSARMIPASLQMMSQLRIPAGNTVSGDINIEALATQFKDKSGKVLATCVLKGNPSSLPIEVAPTASQIARDANCLSNEIVQPICHKTGVICRKSSDCAGKDVCECPAPGTGTIVPFAPHADVTEADKFVADSTLEQGANVLCYQCQIDVTGAGLAPGDPFSMPMWMNVDHGPIGTLCGPPKAPQGCDGNGDGSKDPVVRSKMFMATGAVPTP
jgi:hypothetical protein